LICSFGPSSGIYIGNALKSMMATSLGGRLPVADLPALPEDDIIEQILNPEVTVLLIMQDIAANDSRGSTGTWDAERRKLAKQIREESEKYGRGRFPLDDDVVWRKQWLPGTFSRNG
jgi:hypothetical protein